MANKSARNASSGKAPRKTPVPPGARRAERKAATAQPHSEGEVDRTLKETFPASDAPVWGGSEAERQRRIRKAQAREQSAATPAQEGRLRGKTFAILATHGFEQSELMEPRRALQAQGATVEIVSLETGRIRGWRLREWGDEIDVDLDITAASPGRYDGLVLPGGTLSADTLRNEPRAVKFVQDFFDNGKPVAAICHAPWLLVEAGVVRDRRLTSWPSLKTDLRNAGGDWRDEEVVRDKRLVTSRKPDDIPAFNREMIELFAEFRSKQERKTRIGAPDI